MFRLSFAALALSIVAACATHSTPAASWGKPGVSLVDYGVDGGECAIVAAQANPLVDVQGAAGGISGSNAQPVLGGSAGAGPGPADAGAAVPIGGSLYRDQPPPDFTMRASNQVRAQEIAMRRAREAALRNCLTGRGYREFNLTEEQRAHLATLPEGSPERRAYLHRLGADPAVLEAQAR